MQERADPESKETKKLYMAVLDRENTFVRVSLPKLPSLNLVCEILFHFVLEMQGFSKDSYLGVTSQLV